MGYLDANVKRSFILSLGVVVVEVVLICLILFGRLYLMSNLEC